MQARPTSSDARSRTWISRARRIACGRTASPVLRTVVMATIVALCSCTHVLGAPVAGYRVVHTFPHSTSSYTEGFFYRDGLFYEGTGLVGHSALLVTEPETGRVVQQTTVPPPYFGEGIASFGAISTSGPGRRTPASSTTSSRFARSARSPTRARAGA